MTRKLLLLFLAISLVTGIVVWYTGKAGSQSPLHPVQSSGSEAPGMDPETATEPGVATQGEINSSNPSSLISQRRETYTELAEKLSAPGNTLKRDVFIDNASSRLEAVKSEVTLAIQGDDDAARKILERARECRQFNPMTPLDVETEIAYYRDRFNSRRGSDQQRATRAEERIEQTRTAMLARVENCSWRHTGEFPDLRAQVERQADAGDVLARFYYAMLLKPSPYEENYLLETAAWSDKSLRFTMDNINQNMTVGYLALSFSHAQGIFTHQDARLAGIWAYLVMSCPMNGPMATPYLDTLLSMDRMEYLSGTTVDIGQVWAGQVCRSQ